MPDFDSFVLKST